MTRDPRSSLARVAMAVGISMMLAGAIVLGQVTPSSGNTATGPHWVCQPPPPPLGHCAPGNPAPSARYGAAMTFDSQHQEAVLYGGDTETKIDGETWTWNGSSWTKHQFPDNIPSPGVRAGAAMAYDGQRVVLFGGRGPSGTLGDTWLWANGVWRPGPTAGPPASTGAAMAYDKELDKIVLFGGTGIDNGFVRDTWLWDPGTPDLPNAPPGRPPSWSKEAGGASPSLRTGAAMAYDAATGRKNIVLFGGYGGPDPIKELGDTWIWDGHWTALSPPQPTSAVNRNEVVELKPRKSAGMAFDAKTDRIVMVGGFAPKLGDIPSDCVPDQGNAIYCDGPNYDYKTWTWAGNGWQLEETDPAELIKRYSVAIAQSPGPVPGVVVFGGLGDKRFGDTILWDGIRQGAVTTTSTSTSTTTSRSTTTTTNPLPPRPTVHSLTPASDFTPGGARITIAGSGLAGAKAVSFGNPKDPGQQQQAKRIDCSPQTCDIKPGGSQMVVTAPPHPAGTVDVLVTTAAGTSPVPARGSKLDNDLFTYFELDKPPADVSNPQNPGVFPSGGPVQPAPPSGLGTSPVPNAGVSPVGLGASPFSGSAPVPGAGPVSAGLVASAAVPPAPSAPGAGGSAPPGAPPPGQPGAATPGFMAPGAPTPAAPAAGPFPEGSSPGAAPHYNMVGQSADERMSGLALVCGGAIVLLVGFCGRRRPGAGAAPAWCDTQVQAAAQRAY